MNKRIRALLASFAVILGLLGVGNIATGSAADAAGCYVGMGSGEPHVTYNRSTNLLSATTWCGGYGSGPYHNVVATCLFRWDGSQWMQDGPSCADGTPFSELQPRHCVFGNGTYYKATTIVDNGGGWYDLQSRIIYPCTW